MSFTLGVARGSQRAAALRFRQQIFLREQGVDGTDRFDDVATHLVALNDGEIIAAARLIGPEERPFGFEEYFNLSEYFPNDRVAEVSRYCVREDWRDVSRGITLHYGMLKLVVACAKIERVAILIGSVQPHIRPLYDRVYFRTLGRAFQHQVYGHTTIMWLDVRDLLEGAAHPLRAILEDPRVPEVSL
jgi:predicted GNAT family N-acyltransferase